MTNAPDWVDRVRSYVGFASSLTDKEDRSVVERLLSRAAELIASAESMRGEQRRAIADIFISAASGWIETEMQPYSPPAAQYAISLMREGRDEQAELYLSTLGSGLTVLGASLASSSRTSEAFAANEEAVQVYRQLESIAPNRYTQELANVLNNVAGDLYAHGRLNEAQLRCQEAAHLYESLAQREADDGRKLFYRRRLVQSLVNSGSILLESGDSANALQALREAETRGIHELPDDDPARPVLLARLNQLLANVYIHVEKPERAVNALQQAISTFRTIVAEGATDSAPELAAALTAFGSLAATTGEIQTALDATEDAAQIYLTLDAHGGARNTPNMAATFINLANRYLDVGQPDRAGEVGGLGLQLYRQLAREDPDTYRKDLLAALVQHAKVLSEAGRENEAHVLLSEAGELSEEPERHTRVRAERSQYRHGVSRTTGTVQAILFRNGTAAVCAQQGALSVWDLQTGRREATSTYNGLALALSLYDGSARLLALAEDGRASFVDVMTGDSVDFDARISPAVTVARLSEDGRRLALGEKAGDVSIWAVDEKPSRIGTHHMHGWPSALAFSPSGKQLIAGSTDGAVELWDISKTEQASTSARPSGRGWVTAISALDDDGSRLAIGKSSGFVTIWDLPGDQRIAEITGHTDSVNAIAVVKERSVIITGSDDRTIRLWDMTTGSQLLVLLSHARVSSLAVDENGEVLVASSGDGSVQVWDLPTGQLRLTIPQA
jgi:tetratricopeptide (TPR) repeat protein